MQSVFSACYTRNNRYESIIRQPPVENIHECAPLTLLRTRQILCKSAQLCNAASHYILYPRDRTISVSRRVELPFDHQPRGIRKSFDTMSAKSWRIKLLLSAREIKIHRVEILRRE